MSLLVIFIVSDKICYVNYYYELTKYNEQYSHFRSEYYGDTSRNLNSNLSF